MMVMLSRQNCGHFVRERPRIREDLSSEPDGFEGVSALAVAPSVVLPRKDYEGHRFEDEESIGDPEKWLPVAGPTTHYVHNDWHEYSHCVRFREQAEVRYRLGGAHGPWRNESRQDSHETESGSI